jgi:hypothetical protein
MLGDEEAALRHAAEADVVSERLGAPFFRARNWLEWSDILLAGGDEQDREAAATMLQGAVELSTRLGFPTIESRAADRLDRLG